MSQWGKSDAASNSVLWAPTGVNKAPTATNRNNLYGNVTPDAFITNTTKGMFAVDRTEASVGSGNVAQLIITSAGSGYTANATVTITGGGGASATANAEANATGRIALLNITAAGSSYETNPTVAIAAPSAVTFNSNTAVYKDATFNANTGVNGTTEFITTSTAHGFTNGDKVQYLVATGNTALSGLTNATSYFVISANTTALKLSTAAGGSAVDIAASSTSESGHTLRRVGQGYITIASNVFQVNDYVTYTVASGNTALTGLTSGSKYYVVTSNSTTISVSATKGGSAIVLTPGVSQTGHSWTGETATGVAVVGGAQNKGVAHAGWVLRTVGSGGRAGRVQYETLVAMGSIATDGSDDSILPDA